MLVYWLEEDGQVFENIRLALQELEDSLSLLTKKQNAVHPSLLAQKLSDMSTSGGA